MMDDMKNDVNVEIEKSTPRGAGFGEGGWTCWKSWRGSGGGIGQKALAARLGKSVSEIFRMLTVLEQRGYIVREPKTGEYHLTLRLFQLGTQHPPTRRLQQAALPVMEQLAATLGLACHLSTVHGEQFLVVAQAEPDRPMGWNVKLGAIFPLSMQMVSARILGAFQSDWRREEMARIMARRDALSLENVLARLKSIAEVGHDHSPSGTLPGLTDMSAPVLDPSGFAAASLSLLFLPQVGMRFQPTRPWQR